MKKTAYTIIIIASILTAGFWFLTEGSATTYANGISNGYTTWTATNSPYMLTGNLAINSGDTLNIQPGVIVHLNGYQIQVYGLLNAQGSSNNKIYFFNDGNANSQIIFKSSSSPSCLIDYTVFYSVPVTVDGGSPRITNNYLTSSSTGALITVNSGAASIVSNVISAQSSQNGIHINSGLVTVTSNTITGASYGIYNAGTADIVSNGITGCYSGIYTTGPATIQLNNILYNTNDGIVSQNPNVFIINNAIAYNICGISRDANIQNNTIANNTYGLWGPTDLATIVHNNIMDSTRENVHLTETEISVNAINNYWGSTNEESIALTISDFRAHPHLGNLTFTPFLTQLAVTPAIPSAIVIPTPPPTPTTPPDTITITPTPYPTVPPYANQTVSPYTPHPDETISPTTFPTYDPVQPSDSPLLGEFSPSDIYTAIVILIAVCLAITIIVIINRRFAQTK